MKPGACIPVHTKTLWSARKVDDEIYLDVTLVQRSSDYLVANYINKTQYVALMLMVCSHLGYKPGIFCHFVQNLHIYDRHFEAVSELLNREPLKAQPIIKLAANKPFGEITVDDFIIENTDKINKIKSKLELAI